MSGFQFKQFFIAHDRCAMKVNTDGILLGALADVTNAKQILDLGTGTGLVAIMLAQRTDVAQNASQITALELDPNATEQALTNAQQSPWAKRIHVLNQDVLHFCPSEKFDLIVANPPYFLSSLHAQNAQRNLARHSLEAPQTWLVKAAQWITPNGKICFILPTDIAQRLCEHAHTFHLHCIEQVEICTKTGKVPKRIVLTFSPIYTPMSKRSLTLYDEQNSYTEAFKRLTADFYLMH